MFLSESGPGRQTGERLYRSVGHISRGRLLHGRHFTYKSIHGDTAITFVSSGVEGAFATEEHPYAAHGPWLQVCVLRPALGGSPPLTGSITRCLCEDPADRGVRGADARGYPAT